MFRIAFWSPQRNCGVTSCTVVTGIVFAEMFRTGLLLANNHYQSVDMEDMLLQNAWSSIIGSNGFYSYRPDVSRICDNLVSRFTGRRCLQGEYLELVSNCLVLRMEERTSGRILFESRFSDWIDKAETIPVADVCFIDTESNNNISTQKVLDSADIIVIVVNESKTLNESFFRQYKSLLPKSYFIINQHRNFENASWRGLLCRKGIPAGRLFVLPLCEDFYCSSKNGNLVNYVAVASDVNASENNFSFIREIRRLSAAIGYKSSISRKREERVG